MLSKTLTRASLAVVVLVVAACSSVVPWGNETIGGEVNLAFTIENNLLFLTTATIDGRPGRYFFGSAEARSVVDPALVQRLGGPRRGRRLNLNQRESIAIQPVEIDLRGVGEAIVGADAWGKHAVTIDYRSGLVTMQKEGIHPEYMTLWRYAAEPAIAVNVDGREVLAVVDTASPDTLVLPGKPGRGNARVRVGTTDFGAVDVGYANVAQPRIGNRLLSKFLVTIDYGRRQVGLWRDPRL